MYTHYDVDNFVVHSFTLIEYARQLNTVYMYTYIYFATYSTCIYMYMHMYIVGAMSSENMFSL